LAAKSPSRRESPPESPRRHLAGAIGAIERHNGPHDPRLGPLRAELVTEALAEHIRRVVDAWPPISQATREKLALLLNPGAGDGS
jgi:hypothetical protein